MFCQDSAGSFHSVIIVSFSAFYSFFKTLKSFKMKREKKVWTITLIVLWGLAPSKTNAQQNQDSTKVLSEIVVTATKFAKNQSETGKVLVVIDEEQLKRSSGKDISQLLNEQAGVVVNGANSNPGKDKSVFLQGASTKYTLILVDGIAVNDPSSVGGAFDLRLLPIDQVERIEILKGSQSTLYGTDAIAGVINIITKKKGNKPLAGFGTLSYGSYNTFKGTIGVGGSDGIVNYNVGYTRYSTDGVSEAKDAIGNGTFDKDGVKQNSVNAIVTINPSKGLSLKPFFRFADYNGKYDAGGFADDPTAAFTSKITNYGVTGNQDLKKTTLNWQYGRIDTRRSYGNQYGTFEYKGYFDNAELFLTSDLSSTFQLLYGVNFQNQKMDDEKAKKPNPSITIFSPYASFFLKNIDGFSAELGARYNNHSQFGNAFTFSINPSYFVNERLKLFANYSTGFKAPTLNELYGQFGANDQLKPETSANVQTGAHYFSTDKRFNLRANYFNRQIANIIIYGTKGYVNLSEQNNQGIEIEPTVQINNALSVRGFYAFVDGDNLIRKPKNTFGVNVGYQATAKLFVSANFKAFDARKDSFFDLTDFETKTVDLSDYQLLDVYCEYKILKGKLAFFIDAKNILNQEYYEVYGYSTLRFNANVGVSARL
jgi:vitamin B12 transporter